MRVRIVPEDSAQDRAESDYVRVSTYHDPDDDTVTLATIQRVVEKQRSTGQPPNNVHVKTLVMSQPMSPDEALGLATCYAERKKISVVYTNETDG